VLRFVNATMTNTVDPAYAQAYPPSALSATAARLLALLPPTPRDGGPLVS
jgi:hypothetical protein